MRRALFLFFMLLGSVSQAFTVDSVLQPWLQQGSAGLGSLKNARAAAGAKSLFRPELLAKGLAAPAELSSLGMPLSMTGATAEGYHMRGGVIFPYAQAYLLHYQEGEPETDDHWFRLCERRADGSLRALREFGSCIGELRKFKLKAKGPEFLVVVESGCGSGFISHIFRLDGVDPMAGAMSLRSWQGDLAVVDLDADGQAELLHRSRETPPASLDLRLRLATDYVRPLELWLTTAWRWNGEHWERAGERWGREDR